MTKRTAIVAAVALGLLLPSLPAGAQDRNEMRRLSERYYFEEDVWNGTYLALGSVNVAAGIALVTRDDDGIEGAGYPVIAIGGIQLAVGAIYLALTPGWRSNAYAMIDRDPAEYVRVERERIAGVEAGFPYYKLAELTASTTGLVLGSVGAAENEDTLMGVGAGLGVSAALQLVMESITHDVAKRYLKALKGTHIEVKF